MENEVNGMRKVWNVAIYARVSTDKKDQQESISTQVQSLRKWLIERNKEDISSLYNLVEEYEDQGYSGSNFDRDSFIRMKEDIESGKINMILTRDLSRFSRNYVLAGYYIEDYFKEKNVRFVSVLDNVDTIEEMNDIVPFKNILNEMYIKDCSRRVRDALKQRMIRGSSIASKPLYGYKFDVSYEGNNKTIKLVSSDDTTTEVIKEIYNLYLQGWGFGKIATFLNEKKVPPPSQRLDNFYKAKFGIWTNNSIKAILTNPKYGGYMVQQRWKKISYKKKKIVQTEKSEWIYGNEFDGIVSKEIFALVQETMKKRETKYRYKGENIYPFTTVMRCNECGGSMSFRKKYNGYKCTNSQMGGGRCTSHSVKDEFLKDIITNNLKSFVSKYIQKDELLVAAESIMTEEPGCKNELIRIGTELDKLDKQFQNVYYDKLNGLINDRNFENMLRSIQQKQDSLIKRKQEAEKMVNALDTYDSVYDIYKDKIEKIITLKEFDRTTVEVLIDRIVVSEDSVTKEKKIDIYYKFAL